MLIDRFSYLLDLNSKDEDTFCATLHKSYLFFDYILQDLQKEYIKRLDSQIYFSE